MSRLIHKVSQILEVLQPAWNEMEAVKKQLTPSVEPSIDSKFNDLILTFKSNI